MSRSVRDQARESLVSALEGRVDADATQQRESETLHASATVVVSTVRARLATKKPISADAALDEVIARFPNTLDYLAK